MLSNSIDLIRAQRRSLWIDSSERETNLREAWRTKKEAKYATGDNPNGMDIEAIPSAAFIAPMKAPTARGISTVIIA